MQTQLYFWKPLMERHKQEIRLVEQYYERTSVQFNDIDTEARQHAINLFKDYRFDEHTDESAVAEWADEQEIEMHEMLSTMKSNHLLMTISMLYHMWEQQLVKFSINELSHDIKFSKKVLNFKEVQVIFKAHGVDISETEAWGKIRELKFLANTIKHGDGDSAEKLRK
jgi:hypothetical protein